MTRASLTLSLALALAEEELQAVLADLRTDRWREGSIYIFITGYDGTSYYIGAGLYPSEGGTHVAPASWGVLKAAHRSKS